MLNNLLSAHFFRFFLLIVMFGTTFIVKSQEFLTGLKRNIQIINELQIDEKRGGVNQANTDAQPLSLPFFEDFSNYTGYPNEKLFVDKQAFVNKTFPVFPPTIGVVTLDALNEYGEIYPHLTTVSHGADTLTSRYIRLDSLFRDGISRKITPADSLYFSFYFQPGGGTVAGAGVETSMGNQPKINDSLVLEFGYTIVLNDTTSTIIWDHIWSTPGFNISEWTDKNPNEYFKQILIPITNEDYLRDNFQFRFRNYASLEPQLGIAGWQGNVNQWHIDYIRLDVNRNRNDVFTNDLAFVSPTTADNKNSASFLENYQAMPWKQFQPADMKSHFVNQVANLSDGSRTFIYKYTITRDGNVVGQYTSGTPDIRPGMREVSQEILFNPPAALTGPTTYVITHVFENAAGIQYDFSTANDTCVFEQKFDNYYAYDDGIAEYGYCLNNQYNIAYFAMKFSLLKPDSLSAVHMWFNQTRNSENEGAVFSIIVWEDNNGFPGRELYVLEENHPYFAEEFLDFVEYTFDKKIRVEGNFWIGFKQEGNVQLNIGFDQNTDSRDFFKFNTRGKWERSVFRGTPMMRPIFGEVEKSEPICCAVSEKTVVSPNPASDWVEITNSELRITNVEIYDMMGRNVGATFTVAQNTGPKVTLNISHLSKGIYFIRVHKENNTFETLKLIKN